MLEVVGRIAGHPEPLHHRPGSRVGRRRERDDLVQCEAIEPEPEGRPRRLGRVAVAPGVGRQAPADLDARRERRLE